MSAFDPWAATFEQAEAAQALAAPEVAASPRCPIQQAAIALDINAARGVIEADGGAVLWAVSLCALHGLVMPEWLADCYLGRYRAGAHFEVKSWDDTEAFGPPIPKGQHLNAQDKRRRSLLPVLVAVERRHAAGEAIDKGLFASVGKGLNLGTTQTEKFYYEAKRLYRSR